MSLRRYAAHPPQRMHEQPDLSFGSNHVVFGGMIAPASDTAIS